MNIFRNNPPNPNLQQSNFDFTHNILTTSNFGEMTAIQVDPTIPNDFWQESFNSICKVAALVAPAFTRINAYINSYFVPNQQIWQYWNNFITNRPSDMYTSSSNSSLYDGAYQVPKVHMNFIQAICKIASGNFDIRKYQTADSVELIFKVYSTGSSFNTYDSKYPSYRNLTFGISAFFNLTSATYDKTDFANRFSVDYAPTVSEEVENEEQFTIKITKEDTEWNYAQHGFLNIESFVLDRFVKIQKNLDNFGVPVELLALKPFADYQNEYLNLLPFMAYSKIWNDYIRDPQLQSPELCYRIANGSFFNLDYETGTAGEETTITAHGWTIELADLPPNSVGAHQIESFFKINHTDTALAVLTGLGLTHLITKDMFRGSNIKNDQMLVVAPHYYNGLLCLKYANFGSDYFTSALLDPMAGAKNIEVPDTITALRSANKIQEFLERSAWSRDIYNFFKTHFGSTPQTVEYHKPLLLGTAKVQINIGEQLQTSASTSDSPLGSRAGVAEGYGKGNTIYKKLDDHGYIISILTVTMPSQYYQGLPKHLTPKDSYLDYTFPEFANIGNEAIYQRELFYGKFHPSSVANTWDNEQGSAKDNISIVDGAIGQSEREWYNSLADVRSKSHVELSDVFGYIPRYSSEKFKLDEVHGEFRSSLDFWHTARQFAAPPVLGHSFITYEYSTIFNNLNRIFAVEDDKSDHFYFDIFCNCNVRRSLPLISNPHF